MLDLVHLCQSSLSHLLERANLPCIDLTSEVDGSVTSLTDLSDDSELVDPELCTSLSKQNTFSTIVRLDFSCVLGASHLDLSMHITGDWSCLTCLSAVSALKVSSRFFRFEMYPSRSTDGQHLYIAMGLDVQ
jgi:hypothetical protein